MPPTWMMSPNTHRRKSAPAIGYSSIYSPPDTVTQNAAVSSHCKHFTVRRIRSVCQATTTLPCHLNPVGGGAAAERRQAERALADPLRMSGGRGASLLVPPPTGCLRKCRAMALAVVGSTLPPVSSSKDVLPSVGNVLRFPYCVGMYHLRRLPSSGTFGMSAIRRIERITQSRSVE